jgi:hypothetical protein
MSNEKQNGFFAKPVLAVRCGYSRKVLLIFKWALKFAKDKNGRRCNLGEAYTSACCPNAPIAPVKKVLFNGWVIIMPRCTFNLHSKNDFNQINNNLLYQQLQREGISGAEVIDQNCGWLNGKFVIYDYCQ